MNIFKNISWLLVDRLFRVVGGIFVSIWVARYLGPADFGKLNYSIAYSSFFLIFVSLGLDQILVREIVRKPKLTKFFLGTALSVRF